MDVLWKYAQNQSNFYSIMIGIISRDLLALISPLFWFLFSSARQPPFYGNLL